MTPRSDSEAAVDLVNLTPELIPLLVFLVSFQAEPRKFRTGLYLTAAIGWLAMVLLGAVIAAATSIWDDLSAGWVLLGVLALGALTIAGLAVFMIAAGVTLVLKEGFGLRRLLSVVLGVLMLAFLAVMALAVYQVNTGLLLWLVLLGMPASYLGFGFTSFVIYGSFYPAWMLRYGAAPGVVIVLGSGLIDGQVPPLLADRLRTGRQVFERAISSGRPVALVTSGGKGEDEPVAEAVAMRDFLVADGMAAESVLVEDRSRSTQQNLAYTAELLAAEQIPGPAAVVTSDFHALRAAFLMRKAGIDGYAVGARTVRYFWPTAVIREYVAVLRDHFWLNAVMLALSCVPVGWALVGIVSGMLTAR
jgi:uncharacterized SAM-binding protein YcdF (DUF218 family)